MTTRQEVRRLKCGCDKWISLLFTINDHAEFDFQKIDTIGFMIPGQEVTVQWFSKYGKASRRRIKGLLTSFVFCIECNRRHLIRKFKP